MKFTLTTGIVSLLPIISISVFGYVFPAGQQNYRPVFQPPNWVFPIVWTYVSLALGLITAIALETVSGPYVPLFYSSILIGLLAWLPINYYKYYQTAFIVLILLSFLSISYITYLSYQRVMECIALLPLPFWLVIASCLNGVIYDYFSAQSQ